MRCGLLLAAALFTLPGWSAPGVTACLTARCVADYSSRKTSVALENGQRISFIDSGNPQGLPVLLIHGYTDSARDWQPLEPYLAGRLRLIIVDLRGHGASGKPECCYTRFDLAFDLELLIRRLRIERIDVVGHSLGSLVAQTFAEMWPAQTRKLILVSSTGTSFGTRGWLQDVQCLKDPIDPDSAFMRSWWQQSVSINPDAFSSQQRRDAAAIPAAVWRAIADQSLVAADLGPMLSRVSAPTLLIWGGKDSLVTDEGRKALQAGITGSQTRVFESLGHDLFWEDPAAVAASITDFLAAR